MLRATTKLRAMLLRGRTMSPRKIVFSNKAARLTGTAHAAVSHTTECAALPAIAAMLRSRLAVRCALLTT